MRFNPDKMSLITFNHNLSPTPSKCFCHLNFNTEITVASESNPANIVLQQNNSESINSVACGDATKKSKPRPWISTVGFLLYESVYFRKVIGIITVSAHIFIRNDFLQNNKHKISAECSVESMKLIQWNKFVWGKRHERWGQKSGQLGSIQVNTCSHLFQKTETLRLVSQSSGIPDLISFCSLAGNSNPLLPAPNHNYPSFPDTPRQNSNYQLPLLLAICNGSWPIIKWSDNELPWRTEGLSIVCRSRLSLRNYLSEKRQERNKTAQGGVGDGGSRSECGLKRWRE